MVLLNPLNAHFETSSEPIEPSPLSHRSSSTVPEPQSDSITTINSRFSPWLTPLAYALGTWLVLPNYFRIHIAGQNNLPTSGPVILAPTHRARWDALLVPYVAGRFVTGRDIHFMVTADEVKGIQGWFIRRLGGFPVNPRQPAIASLRYGVEVLRDREMLVIFPEGGIFRDDAVHPLKPGLARLALQAEALQPDLGIQVVPIDIHYAHPMPKPGCSVSITIGKPLEVADYQEGTAKQKAKQLTADLENALQQLAEQRAKSPRSSNC